MTNEQQTHEYSHARDCAAFTVTTDGFSKPCDCRCQCSHSKSQHVQYGEDEPFVDCAICGCEEFRSATIHRLDSDAPAYEHAIKADYDPDEDRLGAEPSEAQAAPPELEPLPERLEDAEALTDEQVAAVLRDHVWANIDLHSPLSRVVEQAIDRLTLRTSTTTTEDAAAYLESINAPVTEDRILWAKFLATKPSVEQVNLASSLVIEDRTRHGAGLAEALYKAMCVIERKTRSPEITEIARSAIARYEGKGQS